MEIRHILTPMTRREIPLLRRWIALCPNPSRHIERLTWCLSMDDRWTDYEREGVQRLVGASKLKGVRLEFFDADLSPGESVYFRTPPASFDLATYPYGLKSGPNLQFFRSIRHVAARAHAGEAAILLETDAHPLRDDWMDLLNSRIASVGDFVVAGARYQGISHIHPAIKDHLNGNSIYGVGSTDFTSFLAGWEAVLLHCLKVDERLAYDAVVDWYLYWRDLKRHLVKGEPPTWARTGELAVAKRIDLSDAIVNFGGAEEQKPGYELDIDDFITRFPQAVIAHGKCFTLPAKRIHYRLTQPAPRAHPLNQAIDALQKSGIAGYFSFRQGAPSDLDEELARRFHLPPGGDPLFHACLSGPFEPASSET